MTALDIPTFIRTGINPEVQGTEIKTYTDFKRLKVAFNLNSKFQSFAGDLANDRIIKRISELSPETRAKWEAKFDAERTA